PEHFAPGVQLPVAPLVAAEEGAFEFCGLVPLSLEAFEGLVQLLSGQTWGTGEGGIVEEDSAQGAAAIAQEEGGQHPNVEAQRPSPDVAAGAAVGLYAEGHFFNRLHLEH